jgi:hypothetical protein
MQPVSVFLDANPSSLMALAMIHWSNKYRIENVFTKERRCDPLPQWSNREKAQQLLEILGLADTVSVHPVESILAFNEATEHTIFWMGPFDPLFDFFNPGSQAGRDVLRTLTVYAYGSLNIQGIAPSRAWRETYTELLNSGFKALYIFESSRAFFNQFSVNKLDTPALADALVKSTRPAIRWILDQSDVWTNVIYRCEIRDAREQIPGLVLPLSNEHIRALEALSSKVWTRVLLSIGKHAPHFMLTDQAMVLSHIDPTFHQNYLPAKVTSDRYGFIKFEVADEPLGTLRYYAPLEIYLELREHFSSMCSMLSDSLVGQ